MKKSSANLLETLIPFMVMGIAIALFIGLFILMSYVLVWGIVIGGILWLVAFIKNKFFPSPKRTEKKQGRVIDYKDIE
jgi:Na+-transporting methylmalonyl-CoA/oxaloacetate decarboxylase gamma subunit